MPAVPPIARRCVRSLPVVSGVALVFAAAAGAYASSGGSSQRLTATESEFKIQLSAKTLHAGPTTIIAVNKGHVAHSLEVDGPGVSDKRIAGTIAPGKSMSLHVALRKGGYEVYCPVDGHKGLGMDTHIKVSG
jgi:uncharacterized cupredoxin-like copper-binding protein